MFVVVAVFGLRCANVLPGFTSKTTKTAFMAMNTLSGFSYDSQLDWRRDALMCGAHIRAYQGSAPLSLDELRGYRRQPVLRG